MIWKYFMTLFSLRKITYYIHIIDVYFACMDKFITLRPHNICIILCYVKYISMLIRRVNRMNLIHTLVHIIYIYILYRCVIRRSLIMTVWTFSRKRQDFDNPRGSWFIGHKEAKARPHTYIHTYIHNNNNMRSYLIIIYFSTCTYIHVWCVLCI